MVDFLIDDQMLVRIACLINEQNLVGLASLIH